jgi:hypothetical protein
LCENGGTPAVTCTDACRRLTPLVNLRASDPTGL